METQSANQGWMDQLIAFIFDAGPKVLLAAILLIVGFWLVRKLTSIAGNYLSNSKVDSSVAPFLKSLISAALKVLLLIVIASTLGIDTTSFVAIIGAITFAIGFALQGNLANFAGGVMLLIFKPFKVGDVVKIQGFWGVVEEIQVFKTTIIAVDRVVHIIPNGVVSNGTISNYSSKGILRVNLKAYIGYEEDLSKAKEVAQKVLDDHPLVADTPAPQVRVFELEKDAVVLGIHPYTPTMKLWDVYFEVQEQIVTEFNKAGIKLARKQLDISLSQKDPLMNFPPTPVEAA